MLERKAAGNTAQAKTVAKIKFAVLCDSWWDRRADQLQCAADAGDIKKVHQLIREICCPTRRKAICLPMPGWNRTTKTAKDTVEAFQVHFKAILNQDRNVDMDFVWQHLHQRPTQGIFDEPISRKEVCEAVKSLKNCKSPGEGIVNEVWKAHERLIDYLMEASNQALEGDVPKEWVDCIIVPVHKKGPVNDPNNYHGIALLSTGGKVFGRCLLGA